MAAAAQRLLRQFNAITVAFAAQHYDQCVSDLKDLKLRLDEYFCDEVDLGTDAVRDATIELFDGLADMAGTDGTPFSVQFAALGALRNAAGCAERSLFSDALLVKLVPLCLRCIACLPGSDDGREWPIEDQDIPQQAAHLLHSFVSSENLDTTLHAAMESAIATWDTSMSWSDKVAILTASRDFQSDAQTLQKLQALGFGDQHPQVRAAGLAAAAHCYRHTTIYYEGEDEDSDVRDNIVRQHTDLLMAMMEPRAALDAPRTLLLRSALLSADECFVDVEADERDSYITKFQLTKLVHLLTGVASAGKAAAGEALYLTGTIVANTGVDCPALMDVVFAALRNATDSAQLSDDEEYVANVALRCASVCAPTLKTDAVSPFVSSLGNFFCRAIDAIAMGNAFMTTLLEEWLESRCFDLGESVLAAWVPQIAGKLVEGVSLTAPDGVAAMAGTTKRASSTEFVSAIRNSTATIESVTTCKAVCLSTIGDIIKHVPLSVLGKTIVAEFTLAACESVDYNTGPKSETSDVAPSSNGSDCSDSDCDGDTVRTHARDIIESVVVAERKAGMVAQYIPPTVLGRLSHALEIEFDHDGSIDELLSIVTTVMASFDCAVPVESAMTMARVLMARMGTVAAALLADETDGSGSARDVARSLGFLHRATIPNECPELSSLMKQAYELFEKLFKTIPALTLVLQTGLVAHGRPCDVVSRKAELVRSATTTVNRAAAGEEDDAIEQALQLSTELLDFTARANGELSLDRRFVKNVVQACQIVLDEDSVTTRTPVRAAIAAAEWLKRNNAPEAAAAAAALCANHLKIDADDATEALEASAIMDRLAKWAADPELRAVYYIFPMTCNTVIEAIEDSEFLSPAGAAALQEARSIEVPETVLPVKKRRR